MSDILPVCLQDFLYSRKSELRKRKIGKENRFYEISSGCLFAAYYRLVYLFRTFTVDAEQ